MPGALSLPTSMPPQSSLPKLPGTSALTGGYFKPFGRWSGEGSRLLDLWYKNAVIYSLNVATSERDARKAA